jgi:hypothetical protein
MYQVKKFRKGPGARTYKCGGCDRVTRQTDPDCDWLCGQCYELAGQDNHFNDNGIQAGSPEFEKWKPTRDALLAKIVGLGGDGEQVKGQNGYLWQEEPAAAPEPLPAVETIDLTPTWRTTVQICCMALEAGTEEGKKAARAELLRLADHVDTLQAK